jgi:hypothetical protein
MSEFDMRARRAGEAAREEARLRMQDVPMSGDARLRGRASRSRVMVAAGLATVLVAVVALAGVVDGVRVPLIEPARPTPPAQTVEPVAEGGVLPVPEVGEALPAYLDDGRPVFVSHPEAGEVVVLDAVDPRAPWGWQQLVAYCSSSGWFEELRHGSRFNGWGEYTGGPSPAGLASYPSELAADGESVRVTGPRGEPPERLDAADTRQKAQRGPNCDGNRDADSNPTSSSTYHQVPTDLPASSGTDLPTDRWTWVTLVIGGVAGTPLVCDADGTCPADAPAVAGISGGQDTVLLDRLPRTVLARRDAQGAIEVILPATDEDGPHPGRISAHDREPMFEVPPRGEVRAAHLPDLTPIFLVHDADGDVRVLEATSPANPTSLVSWCVGNDVFLDARGIRYEADGRPVVAAREGLRRFPSELADLGEARGIRLTGDLVTGEQGDGEVHSVPAPNCTQIIGHQPDERTHVFEPGLQINDERWVWVRMHVERVDGDLYLCAGSDQPCGKLGDPNIGAICEQSDPDDPDTLECEPYRDPVVITPGAQPFDTPRLMLVRGNDNGRAVEIREPHSDAQPAGR